MEKNTTAPNVENGLPSSNKFSGIWGALLSALRRSPIKSKLSSTLHILRQLIHFGPWRVVPNYLIRRLRPAVVLPHEYKTSLLNVVDSDALAMEVRKNSVAIAGVLPQDFVSRQRKVTDRLPYNEYKLVHQVDDDLRRLTEDPGIKCVLRAYLKCEPVLLEASLFVSMPERDIPDQDQNSFHFDYAGWESLSVFVYLTDVGERSSCHVVARGSHRDVGFLDILRGPLTAAEGQRKFGSAIERVMGPAGTVFFENTEAFHRRHKGNERRVMLCLLYASHRSLLSHGRAGGDDVEARNRVYEELRASG